MMFSPVPKKKLDTTSAITAIARSPGPASPSAAVPATQPIVLNSSTRFFAPWASAQAPMTGAVRTISAYDTDSAAVQAKVAHGARPATTATKYALNSAVMTTVV